MPENIEVGKTYKATVGDQTYFRQVESIDGDKVHVRMCTGSYNPRALIKQNPIPLELAKKAFGVEFAVKPAKVAKARIAEDRKVEKPARSQKTDTEDALRKEVKTRLDENRKVAAKGLGAAGKALTPLKPVTMWPAHDGTLHRSREAAELAGRKAQFFELLKSLGVPSPTVVVSHIDAIEKFFTKKKKATK